MADKTLYLGNFVMGMRRDGALSQEFVRDEEAGRTPYILHSLKTMENYDIDYVTGNIYPRNGYERFNIEALPVDNGGIEQVFYHTNLRRDREDIFVIANERWYRVIATEGENVHEMLIDEAVTIDDGYKKPMIVWGDRIFFATDDGWYWTDEDRVYDGTKYYQAGIDKPTSAPVATSETMIGTGQGTPDEGHEVGLSSLANRQIAIPFTLDEAIVIQTINVKLQLNTGEDDDSVGGNIKISIYTSKESDDPNNINGEPDELFSEYSISDWKPFGLITSSSFHEFTFPRQLTPSAETTYFIVLEGDDLYYQNHVSLLDTHVELRCVNHEDPSNYTYGPVLYNNSILSPDWDVKEAGTEAIFYLGGLDSDYENNSYFDYVATYYNSTYGIESRPSESIRVVTTFRETIVRIDAFSAIDDEQVDKIRIYRRILDSGLTDTASEDDITNTYQWVADINFGNSYLDLIPTTFLGAELQTQDHYRITEADDTSNNYRDAIVPACACIWKGRIWVVPVNSNTLYFSKKLEEDGATGITGDTIPDYFPLTNKLEIQEEAAILAIKPLANDQMAIYFRNGPVYVLWGMDEVLNPPSDFSYRPMAYNIGLTSSWGLCDFRGQHIYLSRHGLYSFTGSPKPEYLSENIQSILDSISDANLAKSVLVARGEELWLLVDENDDGDKETIYILNLQKSLPSWRRYNYGVTITDLFVKALSSSSKDVIATDNTNYFVMELETGTTDNGLPIESYIETHQNNVGRAFLHGIELWAEYPEGDVPSYYDFLITDHTGYGKRYQLNPQSAMDDRGRRMGIRLKTYGSFNVRMDQASVKRTDLSSITIRYNEE